MYVRVSVRVYITGEQENKNEYERLSTGSCLRDTLTMQANGKWTNLNQC